MSALQGLDSDTSYSSIASARVVDVGTFSKTMFPSLRLGCCVAPESLVDAVSNARAIAGRNFPMADQASRTRLPAARRPGSGMGPEQRPHA